MDASLLRAVAADDVEASKSSLGNSKPSSDVLFFAVTCGSQHVIRAWLESHKSILLECRDDVSVFLWGSDGFRI